MFQLGLIRGLQDGLQQRLLPYWRRQAPRWSRRGSMHPVGVDWLKKCTATPAWSLHSGAKCWLN